MITKDTFICKCCGLCCQKYTVKLSDKDIKSLEKLGFEKEEFAEPDDFDTKMGRYSLKRINDQCIFLDKKGKKYFCKVYDSRPSICREYPFNESKEINRCQPE